MRGGRGQAMHIHEPAFNNESACDDRSRATTNCDRSLWKCGKNASKCNRIIGAVLSAPTWHAISKASSVHFLTTRKLRSEECFEMATASVKSGTSGRRLSRGGRKSSALHSSDACWSGEAMLRMFPEYTCAGLENILFTEAYLKALQQHAGTNLLQASRAVRSGWSSCVVNLLLGNP